MRPRLGSAAAAVAGPCCEREKENCQKRWLLLCMNSCCGNVVHERQKLKLFVFQSREKFFRANLLAAVAVSAGNTVRCVRHLPILFLFAFRLLWPVFRKKFCSLRPGESRGILKNFRTDVWSEEKNIFRPRWRMLHFTAEIARILKLDGCAVSRVYNTNVRCTIVKAILYIFYLFVGENILFYHVGKILFSERVLSCTDTIRLGRKRRFLHATCVCHVTKPSIVFVPNYFRNEK
jgi:hypothetical protein